MTVARQKPRAQVEYGGGQRGDGGGDTGGDYRVAAARCGTGSLFGARHYRHYDFLLALTDHLPANGLEHHDRATNRVPERTLQRSGQSWKRSDLAVARIFSFLEREIPAAWGLATPNIRSQCGESCCGFMKD